MAKNTHNPPDLSFLPAPSIAKQEKDERDKQKDSKRKTAAVTKQSTVPMTSTAKTIKKKHLKNRLKEAQTVAERNPNDLDKIIEDVQKLEDICSALKCKLKIKDFAITCQHCKGRFCTQHYLPEVHGCGDAAKKDARQKYLHPGALEKSTPRKREQVEQKFQMKLKQMQNSRKKNVGEESKKN